MTDFYSTRTTQSWNLPNVKNSSTDDGNKPEKVYQYNDQDGLSYSGDSQESSPCLACISDIT
jgi:hypothetical protein